MFKCTGKWDFGTVRQAHKAEMCYEFAVQNLELDGTKRGQKAVSNAQK